MKTKIPTPIRIKVPGVRRDVGLGRAIQGLTSALGIRPCNGCQARARALDRRIAFVPGRGVR